MAQTKPDFGRILDLGKSYTLQTSTDTVAVYKNLSSGDYAIAYRGNGLDTTKQDTVSMSRKCRVHDEIIAELKASGFRIDGDDLPPATWNPIGWWILSAGTKLKPCKMKMASTRTHFPRVHYRQSDNKEFFNLSIDGDTALYSTAEENDFRLVVRNDANIMVEGLTFRDGSAWIGAGSDHFSDLQEVLNRHGYTSTVTGTKAIGYTINILSIDGQIHVYELFDDVAPLAKLPCEIKPNIGDLHTLTSDLVRSTNKQTVSRLRAAELDHPDRLIAWSEDNWEERCIEKLKTKLARNEPYDAINYLMFAAYHGWDVSPVSSLTPAKHPCQVFSGERMSEEDAEKVRKAVAEMRNIPHLYPSATMTMDPADDITMVYEFKDAKQRDDYSGLYSVLMDALDQACNGKGRERHANDKPFEEQPMQTFSDALGSPQGLGFQVMKKTAEAMGMDEPERQIRELLGAINYAAGMIIWINRNNQ
ncbi:hypothetical protein XAP3_0051 [Xanthomonas phage XAP3]|nr:hypothetical protein XAP3_0051 [Xanthomonas phage XAP3]